MRNWGRIVHSGHGPAVPEKTDKSANEPRPGQAPGAVAAALLRRRRAAFHHVSPPAARSERKLQPARVAEQDSRNRSRNLDLGTGVLHGLLLRLSDRGAGPQVPGPQNRGRRGPPPLALRSVQAPGPAGGKGDDPPGNHPQTRNREERAAGPGTGAGHKDVLLRPDDGAGAQLPRDLRGARGGPREGGEESVVPPHRHLHAQARDSVLRWRGTGHVEDEIAPDDPVHGDVRPRHAAGFVFTPITISLA